MQINEHLSNLLDMFEFSAICRVVEYIYSRKLNHSCFLMRQNGSWTVVTIQNYCYGVSSSME